MGGVVLADLQSAGIEKGISNSRLIIAGLQIQQNKGCHNVTTQAAATM